MMTFTSEQLATLRKIAQQATQGEWRAFISPDTGTYAVHTPGDERCGDIIKWPGFDGQKNAENNAEFIAAFNPKLVQTLLDERERNQQYIKRRDQENEDIALTVGKLRVELEAEKQRAKDLFMENARLKSGIAGLIHLGIRYADVDVMKIAGDAQLSTPCTDSIINSIATGIRINGGE
ncbi:TPA: ead/Ea22-like family protein [Escherichia coli]|nr:ead/Ea22-like family protein [Escherichia coli]